MSRWKFTDDARFMFPLSITVEIDDSVFTDACAKEMNSFWTGADDRLVVANGNIKRAALLMVAGILLRLLIENDGSQYDIQREFGRCEGMPEGLLKVIDADEMDRLEYYDITITEVPKADEVTS